MLFRSLTPSQINSFFEYKRKYGDFISIYELQAITEWDILTTRKMISYLYVAEPQNIKGKFIENNERGFQQLLIRIGRTGSDATSSAYYSKKLKQTIIYRNTNFKNLSIGLSAEKDAGEKNAFDFTSFYIQKNYTKYFKHLIIGDYLVTMGQGLAHWQG